MPATWRRDLAALAAVVLLSWVGLRGRVPLLAGVDLGFHELGHLVCYVLDAFLPWPRLLTALAGSVAQVAVPLGLAAYFVLVRADRHAAAICLAWSATSAADVATYVADAPHQRLQLIGGEHDWAAILGPAHLDRLDLAASLAATVRAVAVVLVVVAAVTATLPLLRRAWDGSPATVPRRGW